MKKKIKQELSDYLAILYVHGIITEKEHLKFKRRLDNSNAPDETKYIITFEDGTHYISDSYNQSDLKALNDGIITIVRQSDLKELTPDNEWIDLEKWVSG